MKFTKYIVEVQKEDKVILYNTANGGTIRINYDLYERVQDCELSKLSENEYVFFKDAGFLVEDEYDERIIEIIENRIISQGIHLTFLTTDECNFRCPYCYENHKSQSISTHIYERIIDYLMRANKDSLSIDWFGGEPTLRIDDIEQFMNRVVNLNKFTNLNASITTNGYLLNRRNFERLHKCGVRFFQVTIDGVKEEHDRFRYLRNKGGTFDVIVQNIKDILNLELEYELIIRNNYNESSNLIRYVDYIYSLIGRDKRFKLCFSSTGNWKSTGDILPESSSNLMLSRALLRAEKLGLSILETGIKPQNSFCCANLDDSFIINSKGELLRCTVKLDWDKNIIGKLGAHGEMLFNENYILWRSSRRLEKCVDCAVRPVCMGKFCPHIDYSRCEEQKQQTIKEFLLRKYAGEAEHYYELQDR